jgi:glycerol-3-phosphate O-acyltransferase
MTRRFGWLARLTGLTWLVGRLRMEAHSVEQVARAADAGTVVYVLPHRDGFDHFALNMMLVEHGLPLSVWARGIGGAWYRPVGEAVTTAWERLRTWWTGGGDAVDQGHFERWVRDGQPTTLFLEEPRRWGSPPPDAVERLAALEGDEPVSLVPVMVVWDRGPEAPSALRHFFLGRRDRPGLLGRVVNLVWRSREAFVHVGRPIELRALQARVDDDRRVEALRKILGLTARREDKLVRGPQLVPHDVMRGQVLDTPPVRQLAREEAALQGVSEAEVRKQLVREYDRIAARFSWTVIRALHILLQPLWTKVFSGVDVRDEDLDRIRTAMRDGTPILVPCHKSHFDYILVTWVLYHHHLIVPHVVAGMNLAVWPIGRILRGCGGFFIERSFAGKRLHPVVFGRYLRELVRQEYPVEFFIEGGRTRSGRLLPPRVGVLGMVLDAAELRPKHREVTLLPIALAYEQVAEEGAYAAEQEGQPKRRESLGELLKARSVLRRRYGRVYLRVGEPIPCSSLVDETATRPAWSDRDEAERRAQLQVVGQRIVHRIGQAMVLLPTTLVALAALAHHRRGIPDEVLRARSMRFLDFLVHRRVVQSASLQRPEQALTQALDRFVREGRLEALTHEGKRVWSVPPEQRITLDFYKNQVLHLFADALLVAAAVRALPEGPFTEEQLDEGIAWLRPVLAREFPWSPDEDDLTRRRRGLDDLRRHGALSCDDGRWHVVDGVRMGEVHALGRSLLESYLLVLQSTPSDGRVGKKELVERLQREGDALLATGTVTRPEALSRASLTHAIDTYVAEGWFDRDDDGLRADEAAVAVAVDTLAPMVGR